MNNQDDFQFDGFDVPGTTPVPDVVFDKLLSRLTGNELKVLLYIIRRTYGFGKNADAISLSQFREGIKTRDENGGEKVLDEGCGIGHNRTILVALASLEKRGCVISKKRNTHAGDSDTTIYKLRFKSTSKRASREQSDGGVVTSGNDVVTPGNEGSYSTSPRWLPQVTTVVTSSNTQETVLQYTDKQETVLQRDTFGASIDSAALSQLQNENASLKAELEKWIQIADASKVGASPTPVGQTASFEQAMSAYHSIEPRYAEANKALAGDTLPVSTPPQELAPSDQHASSEPYNRANLPLAESQPISVPPAQDKALLGEYRGSEMPSSTQADVESNRQEEKQADCVSDSQTTTQTPSPATSADTPPAQPAPPKTRGRGGRSKEKPVIDEITQKRIDRVYEYFDGLKREVSSKPDARYRRTESDTIAIVEWLGSDPKPTEENLREVYLRLWNTPPDKRSGFSWKRNMWIHSVLKQYEVLEMEIVDERNKQSKRNVVTPGMKSTFVPPPEEEDEMPFVRPSELYSRKRG